jgi:hypothetical protein
LGRGSSDSAGTTVVVAGFVAGRAAKAPGAANHKALTRRILSKRQEIRVLFMGLLCAE